MTREQQLEAALRFVHDDSGFRDLETHTLVAVLNALATPPDADTRVVSVDFLETVGEILRIDLSPEYFAIRAIIEGKDHE